MPLAAASPVQLDLWTFLFQALNVLIVLGILYKFLYKPVAAILEKREKSIEDALQSAASQQEEAGRLLQEHKEEVDKAAREAQAIIQRAKGEAEDRRRQIVESAESEAERTLERAKREIGAERERALNSIRDEAANLALLAAGKVLGESMTDERHKRLADEFIDQLPQTGIGRSAPALEGGGETQ